MKIEIIKELLGKKTLPEIASEIGVSLTTVKRQMRIHNLNQDIDFIRSKRLQTSSLGGKSMLGRRTVTDDDRKCGVCKEIKPVSQFHKRHDGYFYYYCKDCQHVKQSNKYIDRKLKAVEYKGGKCEDCKNVFHYAVFEFHHRDKTSKEMDWNKMRKFKLEQIISELDKCDLLCANCHRMRHVIEDLL